MKFIYFIYDILDKRCVHALNVVIMHYYNVVHACHIYVQDVLISVQYVMNLHVEVVVYIVENVKKLNVLIIFKLALHVGNENVQNI